jgi:F-type H+-transporting ATPase subunit epsilon
MCAPAAGPFYRAAGMSYLKYANICADLMRNVMKEPHKSQAAARSSIYFRASQWVEGKQGKPGELPLDKNNTIPSIHVCHGPCAPHSRQSRSCKDFRYSCVMSFCREQSC